MLTAPKTILQKVNKKLKNEYSVVKVLTPPQKGLCVGVEYSALNRFVHHDNIIWSHLAFV